MEQKHPPLVSVVIPVFNGAKYVNEAIDSVLAQTYPHYEVIVVNDGSTDETEQIALSYRDRIRYFSKENGGVSTALNMGIRNMHGEYFLWLSHDDLLKPDALSEMIQLLTTKQSDGIVYGNFDFINDASVIYQRNDFSEWFPQYLLEWSVFPILTGISNACVTLIHKRHFERVGLFDEKLLYSQDLVMLFKVFKNQALLFSKKVIGSKRFHQEQGQQKYRKQALEGEDKVFYDFLNDLTPLEMSTLSGSRLSFAKYIDSIYGTSDHPLVSEYLEQVIACEKYEGFNKAEPKFERELINVYQSNSWRITAPLRFCERMAGKIKNCLNTTYKRIFKK